MRGGDEFVYAGYKSLLENYLTNQVKIYFCFC